MLSDLKTFVSLHSLPQCFLISPNGFQPQAPDLDCVYQRCGGCGGVWHESVFAKLLMMTHERIIVDTNALTPGSRHQSPPLCLLLVLSLTPCCLLSHFVFHSVSLGSWINFFFLVLLSLSFCLHIALHTAPIKRWDWYWETIKIGLAVCWMFPPCGKWSITSSITSDRGSCFEPAPNESSAWASGATKGEARGILLGTCTHTETHTQDVEIWPSSSVSSLSVYVRQQLTLNRKWKCCSGSYVQRYQMWPSSDPLPMKLCTGPLWSTDHTQPAVLSVAVWLRLTCLSQPDRGGWGWAGGWLTTNVTLPVPCHTSPRHLPSTSDTMLVWTDSLPKDYRKLCNKEGNKRDVICAV